MDIKPGDVCLFDPYNHYNQKEGMGDVVVVTVLKIKKRFMHPTLVDFFDNMSSRLFEDMPLSTLYKVNNPITPNVVIRHKPGMPVITQRDVDLVRYCIEKIDDEDVKAYAKVFYQKLRLYRLSPLFTEPRSGE